MGDVVVLEADHTVAEVRQLLRSAEANVARCAAALDLEPGSPVRRRLLFSAEQGLLLVRVAADSAARRVSLRSCDSAISTVGC